MAWFTAGVQVNPAAGAVLADSGALAAGQTEVTVIFGGNIAAVATIEHRNAANTANLNSQVIACLANDVIQAKLPGVPIAASERIRVTLNATIVGSVQASVFVF